MLLTLQPQLLPLSNGFCATSGAVTLGVLEGHSSMALKDYELSWLKALVGTFLLGF